MGVNVKSSLLEIFLVTLKIGGFTFGGGWAMVPLMRNELVSKRGWLSEEEFMDIVCIAQGFPGPIMVNLSVMCGNRLLGLKGALVALLGSVLPSLVVILLIASALTKFGESSYIKSFLNGMKPALFSVLIYAIYRMRKTVTGSGLAIALALIAFLFVSLLKVNPFFIIAIAALSGTGYGLVKMRK